MPTFTPRCYVYGVSGAENAFPRPRCRYYVRLELLAEQLAGKGTRSGPGSGLITQALGSQARGHDRVFVYTVAAPLVMHHIIIN